MDSFTIAGPTSGPDLNYTYSYTSILRLGLAAGDTPDAPHKHLGTRGPALQHQPYRTPSEARAIKRRTWSSELEHYSISLTYTIGGESNQATHMELGARDSLPKPCPGFGSLPTSVIMEESL
ncbi:hypothetical protein F511_34766 [Dorcoceras hygrometricum]|uniref:Uncharacterized protein n=1 Tax=Dorcoceras hygrometricum TaxID=472368 RepID=A0A2Z7ATI2_9LAMI|nr:hypothetical protein F511_34766 [Dorcoceras hygrometricum]